MRVGAYEIMAPLGSGGMGEVYRARDARLDRPVAIKVLPQQFAENLTALGRFEREAKAVAALSHPNILSIFDFGRERDVAYAVMELLEGETLRQKLAGPIPVRKAVDYGVQIARGLAAAHDKGIAHRDLKPENVFVTTDGRVKILDFGLARQTPAFAGADATVSPTVERYTDPGTVLGTVGYMSPEQARGEPGDHRSDLFSLAVVMYELVSGRRAFQRGTAAETLTAILREDPPELTGPANGVVPPALARVIHHGLEKNPNERFQSASDMGFALEAAVGVSSSSHTSAVAAVPRTRSVRGLVAAIVGAIAVAAVFGWYAWRADRANAAATTVQPAVFRRLSFDNATAVSGRFAPDGRTIVYSAASGAGTWRLLLTRLEFPGATPLALSNAVLYSVSPEAEMLVGVNRGIGDSWKARQTTLVRLPMFGGAMRPVLEHVTFADWSPVDSAIAVVRTVGSQQRLEFPIGTVLFQTEGEIGWPRVSPAGDRVAFLDWPVKDDDRGAVAIVDRKSNRQTISKAWEGVRGLAWTPAGDEVWYTAASVGSDYSIWSAAVGRPERRVYSAPGGVVLNDIARDGKALLARTERGVHVEGSLAGEGGVRDLSWLAGSFARDLSRDNRILLSYFGQGSSPNYDVYVRGWNDAEATRVGEGQGQQFSPDGRSVLVVVHGPPSHLAILAIGPGETKVVATGSVQPTQARWLPDGRRLLVIGTDGSQGVRAYVVAASGSMPQPITPEGIIYHADHIALSHDGAHVAFVSPEGAVTVYSIDGKTAVPAVGFAPGEIPIGWSGDDRSLLTLDGDSARRIVATDVSTGRREIVREITPSDSALTGPTSVFLSRDGRSYVANYQRRQATLFLAEGLR
jgi:hypothetical protein